VKAANAKSDRERFYATLRERAQAQADKYLQQANKNARFKEISALLSKMEFSLAKAEISEPEKLPALETQKKNLWQERKEILSSLGIEEAWLVPQYNCKKCSDTGFLKNGKSCDCYKKENG
jgi:DNA replication protein DnaC